MLLVAHVYLRNTQLERRIVDLVVFATLPKQLACVLPIRSVSFLARFLERQAQPYLNFVMRTAIDPPSNQAPSSTTDRSNHGWV